MKNEKLANAFNQVDDRYIAEAAAPKARKPYWIGAVAAVLALIIAISAIPGIDQPEPTHNMDVPPMSTAPSNPPTIASRPSTDPSYPNDPLPNYGSIDLSALLDLQDLLAAPTIPTMMQYPQREAYGDDWKAYDQAYSAWRENQNALYNQPTGYADSLEDFFYQSIQQFLTGEENGAYSPVNVYMAMAMLAETTDGESRQQILDLFGLDTIEQLRTQVNHLWNAHFSDDGLTTLVMSNSLWLDDAYTFRPDAVDRLSKDYFASVFGGDLGSDESNAQLQTWLDAMTGGLLSEQAKNVELSRDAVFALASTIYFKAGWLAEFSEAATKENVFHAPNGDVTVSFMNQTAKDTYYRGSNFGAVRLALTGGNHMWIILPDEGFTVAQVLAGSEYLEMTLHPNEWPNQQYVTLQISLPKFDVSQQSDLIKGMKNMGITNVFDSTTSDFSPIYGGISRLFVSQINHAARVVIDEEGVIAAAFTVIEVNDEGVGPDLPVITFTVDRPFTFIVSSRDNLPLFAGVVTQP